MEVRQETTKNEEMDLSSLYDIMYIFVFPPISLISLAANLLAYRILSSRFFQKKPIYTYLRVCCLNSSVGNFIYAVSFICETRRYLNLSNTKFGIYFRCFFKLPVNNTCFFYGSLLDILLAIDRLAEFTPIKTKFRHINANRLCAGAFVTCLLINLPFFFVFEPNERVETVTSYVENQVINHTRIIYLYRKSRFATSYEGEILVNIQNFIRDILTVLVLIAINLTCLILFW